MTIAATELPVMTASDLDPPAAVFLARHGFAGQPLQPLANDASARRYYRLPQQGLLLMEDRADPVGFAAFIRLSRHLGRLGLSAPQVSGADPATGLALVEDFGANTYAACLAAGLDETALYRLAVETLLQLHHDPRGTQVTQPIYDMGLLLDELDLFAQWFAPAVAPPGFDVAGFAARWRSLWQEALTPVAGRADTLVLKDFHVDNLMLLSDRQGVARCGLLDFQDGLLGPCEYDLVSLLQDARRDLAPGLEAAMLDFYIANAPSHLGDAEAIRARYGLLGAQRHARILGVFVRLHQRDGKPRYLSFMPRVAAQLATALEATRLEAIRDFLNSDLPDWAALGAALAVPPNRGNPHV